MKTYFFCLLLSVFLIVNVGALKNQLTLEIADSMCSIAVQTALQRKFKPISVVVLDMGGNTIVSKRMDGCAPVGFVPC